MCMFWHASALDALSPRSSLSPLDGMIHIKCSLWPVSARCKTKWPLRTATSRSAFVFSQKHRTCCGQAPSKTLYEDLGLIIEEQILEPFAIRSGHFHDADHRWSIFEKEAYAIMATAERMHWLFATDRRFDLLNGPKQPGLPFSTLRLSSPISCRPLFASTSMSRTA